MSKKQEEILQEELIEYTEKELFDVWFLSFTNKGKGISCEGITKPTLARIIRNEVIRREQSPEDRFRWQIASLGIQMGLGYEEMLQTYLVEKQLIGLAEYINTKCREI